MSEARTRPVIEPVVKTITVPWSPERAFARFTEEIGSWWPLETHSVGRSKAVACAFEPRRGGRLYETSEDGSEHVWGNVTVWEPPRRVAFTWHPGRDPETKQVVDVTFEPAGDGARVRLVHAGWERLGDEARRTRDAYVPGWNHVLEQYSEG